MIHSQGSYQGCVFNTQSGCIWEATDWCSFHINDSLSLSSSSFPKRISKKISWLRIKKQEVIGHGPITWLSTMTCQLETYDQITWWDYFQSLVYYRISFLLLFKNVRFEQAELKIIKIDDRSIEIIWCKEQKDKRMKKNEESL